MNYVSTEGEGTESVEGSLTGHDHPDVHSGADAAGARPRSPAEPASRPFLSAADSDACRRAVIYAESHTDAEDEPCAVCISMPKGLFTDSNLENLKALIAAKGSLIKKALGVNDLPLEITDTKVSFPWFPATPTPDAMKAYDTFICKLCEMARNQSRVNSSEKPIENEKYAFRCFLLRLGFIGDEYKAARKILLKNLSGSSAFRNGGAQHEISE